MISKTDYDVDWSIGGSTITNPIVLTYKQLVKEEEVNNQIMASNMI